MPRRVQVLFPPAVFDAVEAFRAAHESATGVDVTRTAAVLALVRRGLEAEADRKAAAEPSARVSR